jgi:hypothetical protein
MFQMFRRKNERATTTPNRHHVHGEDSFVPALRFHRQGSYCHLCRRARSSLGFRHEHSHRGDKVMSHTPPFSPIECFQAELVAIIRRMSELESLPQGDSLYEASRRLRLRVFKEELNTIRAKLAKTTPTGKKRTRGKRLRRDSE